MTDTNIRSAVETDINVQTSAVSSALAPQMLSARTDVARVAADIKHYTDELLMEGAPEKLGQRLLDALLPSAITGVKRRGDREMMEARVNSRVKTATALFDAQAEQMKNMVEGYTEAACMEVTKEVVSHAIRATADIEQAIIASGTAFDQSIDRLVEEANSLKSQSARESAAQRIQRLKNGRGNTEEVAMARMRDALGGDKRRS